MAEKTKQISFSPHSAIAKCNGKMGTSGINWSYATFPTQRDMAVFIAECRSHGYRTRYASEFADSDGWWSVQYHHYED